jgi:hypothetical protein
MSKTRTLLVKRRKQLLKKIAPFSAELEEVEAALRFIESKPPTIESASTDGKKLSIGKQVLVILRDTVNGLPTKELVEEIQKRFDRKVSRANLSWHLSHLKRDARLVNLGGNWKLPS